MSTPELLEEFDRAGAVRFSDFLMSMLGAVAGNFGLEVTRERCRWTPNSFTLSVVFRTTTESGIPGDFAEKALKVGVPADCWGERFFYNDKPYTVVGVKPQNRKYPLIVRDDSGKVWKVPAKWYR